MTKEAFRLCGWICTACETMYHGSEYLKCPRCGGEERSLLAYPTFPTIEVQDEITRFAKRGRS